MRPGVLARTDLDWVHRFRAHERDPLKRWKLTVTGEDWRNLSHRADYEEAIEDMGIMRRRRQPQVGVGRSACRRY
jgi:polyphosphate kinase 2 (PPK2 family)